MEYFKRFFSGFGEPEHENGVEYSVKILRPSGDFVFMRTYTTRKLARSLKKLMQVGSPAVECHIIRREWDNGFIVSEYEVW